MTLSATLAGNKSGERDNIVGPRDAEPACATCTELVARVEREGGVPVATECRCIHGRFDKKGRERWFAPSGVRKPNKTVAEAQEECPVYRPKPT